VAVAAVNSTISLYYYLRIVRQMYIEPMHDDRRPILVSKLLASTITVLTVSVVLLGIIPTFYEKIHRDTNSWFQHEISFHSVIQNKIDILNDKNK
jgi:NADH:ubiquinone oxidoreductase subunit 2 (subunit N)